MIKIRSFQEGDTSALLALTHQTIRHINSADYTLGQVEAWIAGMADEDKWTQRFLTSYTRIADLDGEIAGFANLEPDGYLDNIYCHASHQGKGIASALLKEMESKAKELNLPRIYANVSVTAKRFFEGKHFKVIREELAPYRGEVFRRFEMELTLV